jgi:hypothetical protein
VAISAIHHIIDTHSHTLAVYTFIIISFLLYSQCIETGSHLVIDSNRCLDLPNQLFTSTPIPRINDGNHGGLDRHCVGLDACFPAWSRYQGITSESHSVSVTTSILTTAGLPFADNFNATDPSIRLPTPLSLDFSLSKTPTGHHAPFRVLSTIPFPSRKRLRIQRARSPLQPTKAIILRIQSI